MRTGDILIDGTDAGKDFWQCQGVAGFFPFRCAMRGES
jgi:hypothetical protein